MIGKLRHRIAIEVESAATDSYGGQLDPWASPRVVARVWARIEPLRGREQLRGMQLESRVTHRVVIRHRSDVGPANRLRFGTRLFNIRAVIDVEERSRWLELLCEEGVAT